MSAASPAWKSLHGSPTVFSFVGLLATFAGATLLAAGCGPSGTGADPSSEAARDPADVASNGVAEARGAEDRDGRNHAPASLATSTFSVFEVSGMRCVSCAERIVAELEAVDGVREVFYSEVDARFSVDHDARLVAAAGLEKRIEKLGYEAVLRPQRRSARPPAVPVAY